MEPILYEPCPEVEPEMKKYKVVVACQATRYDIYEVEAEDEEEARENYHYGEYVDSDYGEDCDFEVTDVEEIEE